MKWMDFFSKRFGIDVNSEMEEETDLPDSTPATPENNTPITPSPSISDLEAKLTAALKENESLKAANNKLVEQRSIEGNETKSIEETIYALFGKGENNGNK